MYVKAVFNMSPRLTGVVIQNDSAYRASVNELAHDAQLCVNLRHRATSLLPEINNTAHKMVNNVLLC